MLYVTGPMNFLISSGPKYFGLYFSGKVDLMNMSNASDWSITQSPLSNITWQQLL